jgi:hypothetical protein
MDRIVSRIGAIAHSCTCWASALGLSALLTAAAAAQEQKIGAPPEARNMRLVGYSDLQARSAYQPTIHRQGERYIAYIGHHGGSAGKQKPMNPLSGQAELNGTSILDVTDPKQPRYLAHIPGDEGEDEAGGAQMVRVCDGKSLGKGDPNAIYMLRVFGKKAQEFWNVTDPTQPKLLWRLDGLRDTHKNFWECDTGIAYLVSGIAGWFARATSIYDASDPANPVKIRDFGLIGQQPGATGEMPIAIHGMISTGSAGNRVYFGYGTNSNGVLQIVDREKLLKGAKEPTPENLLYPQIGRLDLSPMVGAHTTFPLGKVAIPEFAHDEVGKLRDMIMIVNEVSANECTRQARQMVFFADATVESKPMIVSHWTVPDGGENFCARGGRFGAHSSHESMAPVFYRKLAFISWFNAGLRVLDVRNPYEPKEVAYFIPAITENTEKRCIKVGGQDRCKVAIQSNNAEIDDRGYIYVVDRANTGLHVLELTGDARSIAGLP